MKALRDERCKSKGSASLAILPHRFHSRAMRRRASSKELGLTLLEAALLIAIVGGAFAAFFPVFFREVKTSKIAEASANLEVLYQLTEAYFERRHEDEEGMVRSKCLPPSAGPLPAKPTPVRTPLELHTESDDEDARVFAALGFDPGSVRYRYSIVTHHPGCGLERRDQGPDIEFVAEGDLDDDGVYSLFIRGAAIDEEGKLVPHGPLRVRDRVE